MFQRRRVVVAALILVAAALWMPIAAGATESMAGAAPSAAAVGAPPTGKIVVAGVELAIDPASGRLVPPAAEQLAALRESLGHLMTPPAQAAKVKHHPNGAESVPVGLWQFGAAYAFVDPNHGLQTGCAEGAENLQEVLDGKVEVE